MRSIIMSFHVLAGLNKKSTSKHINGASFWSAISNLQNDSFAAKVAGTRLNNTLKKDVAIRNAVAVLKQARNNFTKYGATEAAMAVFNQDNQLAQSLNISIPKVNSVNAVAIGKACCKRINSKINDTVQYANHYGNTTAAQMATLINKTGALSASQKHVLEMLYNRVANDIKTVNAKQFNRSTICGYAKPVFVDRVSALQFIIDNLHRCNSVVQCKKSFGKQFAILGWNVTDDGEIVEATPEEVAENAPAEDEVMSPVTDPETGDVVKEDEADPELVQVPEGAEAPDVAPTEAQEQPMAIFGWTPTTVKQATGAVHKLTNYITKLANAYSNVVAAKKKLRTSVESYGSAIEKAPVFTTIENCRKYNTLVGSLIVKYNDATTELVNQAVAMYGVLKDAEVFPTSAHAVNVKSITAKTPWGLRNGRGFFNEDTLPEGDADGQEDESGTPVAGELETETEGPTKSEDPVETPQGPGPVVDRFEYDDEDDIPEGDANGEEDAAGVELPGDLEDDVEGPTEAEEPEGETTDRWGNMTHFFDEDDEAEAPKEEDAEEGDDENEDEEKVEEDEAENTEDEEDAETGASEDEDDAEPGASEDEDEKPSSEGFTFFDEDDIPEGDANGEEDVSGTPVAGELEDDEEGPTDAEEPAETGIDSEPEELPESEDKGIVEDPANDEATTDSWRFTDEDDIPEGDANGEEDGSGVELPGDLEDDTEGPTKATEPQDYRFLDEDGDDVVSDDEVSEVGEGDDEAADEEPSESGEIDSDAVAEVPSEDESADDDAETSPMVDLSYLDEGEEDGDAPAGDEPAEVTPTPEVSAEPVDDDELGEGSSDGDEPAEDSDDIKDDLETQPDTDSFVSAPSEDESVEEDADDEQSELIDFLNEDGDITGPNTPDEFPTEPTDTPDGIDPNGEVDIPEAQTEPYMQPEETPAEDIPNTTIENRRRQYFE